MLEQYSLLLKMLQDAGIPFETCRRPEIMGYQAVYPSNAARVCSVITGAYTYGGDEGLLEIMGLLTEEEREIDSVKGWLTAEDVFSRIQKHWQENGGAADGRA